MLCKICRGPLQGQTRHFPTTQEISALILLGDLAPVEDTPEYNENKILQQQMQPTTKPGWSVVMVGAVDQRKPMIQFVSDGGEVSRYSGIPSKVRRWVFDPSKADDGRHEFVDPHGPVPEAIVAEFRALSSSVDPDFIGEQKRRSISNLESQMKNQGEGKRRW